MIITPSKINIFIHKHDVFQSLLNDHDWLKINEITFKDFFKLNKELYDSHKYNKIQIEKSATRDMPVQITKKIFRQI